MKLEYKHMNVVDTLGTYVNIQCISEDCKMGAGVAVAYNKELPMLKGHCINYMCEPKRNGRGIILPTKYTEDKKEIYCMFTKEKYWYNAYKGMSYKDYLYKLGVSLEYVRDRMIEEGKKLLAMPKIGSGRDKLDWKDAEALIIDVFKETDFEILVCEWRG